MTEEHKRKISEALKGRKKSPLHKVNISYGMKEYHRRRRLEKILNQEKEIELLKNS